MKGNVRWLTTALPTKASQRWVHSCVSGYLCTRASLVNVVSSTVKAAKEASLNGRRDVEQDFGCNPCSEIILRPYQFCNLSEVVVRASDTQQTLTDKVRLATILGTFQSTLTNFKYLRNVWKKNTEEERLLGVSLTGIMDNAMMSGKSAHLGMNIGATLNALKEQAITTNAAMAEQLGIPQSAAITCVKPSGTVLTTCGQCLWHPRPSQSVLHSHCAW